MADAEGKGGVWAQQPRPQGLPQSMHHKKGGLPAKGYAPFCELQFQNPAPTRGVQLMYVG